MISLQSKNKRALLAIVVLLTAGFSNIIFAGTWQAKLEDWASTTLVGNALWHLIPVVLVLIIFHGIKQVPEELGIDRNITKALLYALLFTSPLLIGLSIVSKASDFSNIPFLLAKTFKEGFTEELFFRAFLFGQLFRRCRWGFIPAAGIPAVLFGMGHLYQGDTWQTSLGAFAITFMGAAWFSWLFAEWQFNIWLTIFMHFLMNFYWDFFSVSNGATGSILSNIFRAVTIFLSILITIRKSKKKPGKLVVNRSNLLRWEGTI